MAIQYAPQLFSAIKLIVDREKRNGLFWLTGSQKFQLMRGITESLAGRVASQTVRWHPRVDRGRCQIREHQPVVCEPRPAAGLSVAHDCRGDSERAISSALDHEAPDRAVPDGVGEAAGALFRAEVVAFNAAESGLGVLPTFDRGMRKSARPILMNVNRLSC